MNLILMVIVICVAFILVAAWGWWRQRLWEASQVPFEPEARVVKMTFDEYCDHFGITDEEAPAALAAYLNYVSDGEWNGGYEEVK